VFENKVLRRMFELKKRGRENYIMRSLIIVTLHLTLLG
jgi:hypothetical protein